MNSRNLQYFLTVANEHSISVAAKKLYVSQPSLSEAIKRIEEQVGAPLFKRTQKGLALTDTGRQFYAAASQTQKIWQDFYLNLNASDEMRISRLSFGVTTQLGLKVLPNILLNFNKQFPLVDCNIEDIRHRELEQKLLDGEIDLAITHTYPNTERPSIDYDSFLHDPFVILCSADSDLDTIPGMIHDGPYGKEIDLKMLKGQNLILPRPDNQTRSIIDRALAQADIFTPAELYPNHQFQTIQGLASAGIGIGIIPYSYITPMYAVKIYHIPEEYHAFWNVCIAKKRGYVTNYVENQFIQIAAQVCKRILTQAPRFIESSGVL